MCLNNDIISLEEGGCSNMKKERDLIQETKDLGIIDVKFSGEGSSKIKATENLYDSIKPEVCNKFVAKRSRLFSEKDLRQNETRSIITLCENRIAGVKTFLKTRYKLQ